MEGKLMGVDIKTRVANTSGIVENRVTKFQKRWDMFNDNYAKQVHTKLKEIYINVALIGMDKQVDLTNNIFKTITEKVSRVYTSGINRDFGDNETLTDLYSRARVTKYMKQANVYLNAFNDVLLQVSWDDEKGLPRFNFRLPHRTKVLTDDSDNVSEVEYFISYDAEEGEKWAYWSDDEHYYKIYTKEGNVVKEAIEGNEQMINPYGVLPFVVMQKGFRDGEFFDVYSGDDLVNITLDNAIYNTFKNYLIKWQSFKQLVVTGTNVGQIDGQILDPASALTAEGEDTNISLLDLQANLTQLVETIEASSTTVAVNYNISPSQFRMTGQTSSGFALQMENKALDEFTADQQKDFIMYEKNLLELIVLIGNINTVGIPEAQEVDITFNPIRYSESMTDTLNAQEKSISLALKSPIEIIADARGITWEEAEIIYAQNIKDRNMSNEQFNTRVPTVTLPDTEGN